MRRKRAKAETTERIALEGIVGETTHEELVDLLRLSCGQNGWRIRNVRKWKIEDKELRVIRLRVTAQAVKLTVLESALLHSNMVRISTPVGKFKKFDAPVKKSECTSRFKIGESPVKP